MKQFLLLCLLSAGSLVTYSQSVTTKVNFKKALQPALNLQLTVPPKTAEETILAKLKETGYKPEKNGGFFNKRNKEEGFYKFSGVVLPELANEKLDLYFKIDQLDNDNNYRSAITLLVSKGYDNFVSSEADSSTFASSEKFLNGFVQNTNVYSLNQQIDEQTANLASSEKKWKELRDKQEDAKKKIVQLNSDIQGWQQEEAAQQQEVDKMRSQLKDLEGKRTSAHN